MGFLDNFYVDEKNNRSFEYIELKNLPAEMVGKFIFAKKTLMEYATQMPLACHLKYGKKWELKQILTDLGGKIYTQRRKEGFGMPIGKWLREKAGKPYIAMLQNPQNNLSHYLPARYTQNLVRQHLTQQHDYSSELWALLFLEIWLGRF